MSVSTIAAIRVMIVIVSLRLHSLSPRCNCSSHSADKVRLLAFADAMSRRSIAQLLDELNEVEAENAKLRRQLAARAADDPQPPSRPDEAAPEGDEPREPDPGEDSEDIAKEAEEKRKKKLKDSIAGDDDQSSSPAHDPADEDAAIYEMRVAASIEAVLAADKKRRGVIPSTPAAAGDDDQYWRTVRAVSDAIILADRRARGVVETPVPMPENKISAMIVRAYHKSLGGEEG